MTRLEKELENTAVELAVAEDRVEKLRRKKWSIVRKMTMGKFNMAVALDENEEMTLFDKIEKIKTGLVL
jgi:hypothetical protein